MTCVFDIKNNYKLIEPRKKAKITKSDDIYSIRYKGPLASAGFRAKLRTKTGTKYRIDYSVELTKGDVAFLYCESIDPVNRLLSRDDENHLITCKNVTKSIFFTAITEFTHIGILFHNPNVEYQLLVSDFKIIEVNATTQPLKQGGVVATTSLSAIKSRYKSIQEETDRINAISLQNHLILRDLVLSKAVQPS